MTLRRSLLWWAGPLLLPPKKFKIYVVSLVKLLHYIVRVLLFSLLWPCMSLLPSFISSCYIRLLSYSATLFSMFYGFSWRSIMLVSLVFSLDTFSWIKTFPRMTNRKPLGRRLRNQCARSFALRSFDHSYIRKFVP